MFIYDSATHSNGQLPFTTDWNHSLGSHKPFFNDKLSHIYLVKIKNKNIIFGQNQCNNIVFFWGGVTIRVRLLFLVKNKSQNMFWGSRIRVRILFLAKNQSENIVFGKNWRRILFLVKNRVRILILVNN